MDRFAQDSEFFNGNLPEEMIVKLVDNISINCNYTFTDEKFSDTQQDMMNISQTFVDTFEDQSNLSHPLIESYSLGATLNNYPLSPENNEGGLIGDSYSENYPNPLSSVTNIYTDFYNPETSVTSFNAVEDPSPLVFGNTEMYDNQYMIQSLADDLTPQLHNNFYGTEDLSQDYSDRRFTVYGDNEAESSSEINSSSSMLTSPFAQPSQSNSLPSEYIVSSKESVKYENLMLVPVIQYPLVPQVTTGQNIPEDESFMVMDKSENSYLNQGNLSCHVNPSPLKESKNDLHLPKQVKSKLRRTSGDGCQNKDKRTYVYEITEPFKNKALERKRLNAINAKMHRDQQKKDMVDLEMHIADTVIERDILKQTKMETESSIDILTKELQMYKHKFQLNQFPHI